MALDVCDHWHSWKDSCYWWYIRRPVIYISCKNDSFSDIYATIISSLFYQVHNLVWGIYSVLVQKDIVCGYVKHLTHTHQFTLFAIIESSGSDGPSRINLFKFLNVPSPSPQRPQQRKQKQYHQRWQSLLKSDWCHHKQYNNATTGANVYQDTGCMLCFVQESTRGGTRTDSCSGNASLLEIET